jgi:MurNAc alpha-1-phosphate uridylyltransferase
MPLLGPEPFLVINADIYTDFDFSALKRSRIGDRLAHLVLVDNPAQHPHGDFALEAGRVRESGTAMLTFSGIGIYAPRLFSGIPSKAKVPLAPLLRKAMGADRVSGEHYRGRWHDIGTAERLQALDAELRGKRAPA